MLKMYVAKTKALQSFDLQRLYFSFVIQTGIEPITYSLEGCCSIQLSYWTSINFSFSGCKYK